MAMIGTAGWSIPARYKPQFPGEGSVLERYAQVLSAVEINSSFYRPHKQATYERWAASVPSGFGFSVKLPKGITHLARLRNTGDLLDAFAGQVEGLGDKLKVVLAQLPPSLQFDSSTATSFFRELARMLPGHVETACEPRHSSWLTQDADACLADHRIARVAADPVLFPGGEVPGGWRGLTYRRLHGAPRVYYSDYSQEYLEGLAAMLVQDGQDVRNWCVFDNTASGAALGNALMLKAMPNT